MKRLLAITLAFVLLMPGLRAAGELDALRTAFVQASSVSYAPDAETRDRFIAYSEHGKANDVLLLQLYMSVHLPDEEVRTLLEGFTDGHWNDIDYADQTRGRWNPTLHVTRMYALAKLYVSPESGWKGDPRLKALLHEAMAFWFREMPLCPNWWHNDIGVPKKMTAVLLMLRDELSEAEIQGGLKVLERSRFGRTGQNKVWLAGNNLMKGLLTDDAALVRKSRDIMAEELVIAPEGQEGIQPDWSFQQHGPQIQFGNYGLAYAEGLSFWARVLHGTSYDFTPEQYEVLVNMMREGISRCVWNGSMDPSFCGRQVFPNALKGKAASLSIAEANMAAAGYGRLFRKPLTGAKYYPQSDCGIYRSRKWYASSRMHSVRTIGFEYTNRENLDANFSADGALLTLVSGDEYNDIFACWDWRAVPGVTAWDDGKSIKVGETETERQNHSAHVGGAVFDDCVLCTTMEINRDGLHAFKTAFFFKDLIINLGTDIRMDRDSILSVTTALEQNHYLQHRLREDGSVWHDGRLYRSLDGHPLEVSDSLQHGLWDRIDPFFHDARDSCRIFKCLIRHDLRKCRSQEGDTYAYSILPCREDGGRRLPRVKILENSAQRQVVRYKGYTCTVTHQGAEPGIEIRKGFRRIFVSLEEAGWK